MKKAVWLIAAVAALSLMVGCGSNGSATQKSETPSSSKLGTTSLEKSLDSAKSLKDEELESYISQLDENEARAKRQSRVFENISGE